MSVQVTVHALVAPDTQPVRRLRLHNNHVGMLLGNKRVEIGGRVVQHGHASATAVKLLAIKSWHEYQTGTTHTLNKDHVKIHYGIGWRRFREGIWVLTRAGVLLERVQKNHRTFATEVLAPASKHYVEVDAELLECKPVLLAFIVVVNLSPRPMLPAKAASRFGITSATTIRDLRDKATELGAVAYNPTTGEVARKGHRFTPVPEAANKVKNGTAKNGVAKNGVTKNGDTQKKLYDAQKKKLPGSQKTLEDSQIELPPPPPSTPSSSSRLPKVGSAASGVAGGGEGASELLVKNPQPPPRPARAVSRDRRRSNGLEPEFRADAEQAMEYYNEAAEALDFQKAHKTEARLLQISKRLPEIGGVEVFHKAVWAIEKDDFLMGLRSGPEKEPFRLTWDRLMSTRSEMGDVLARAVDLIDPPRKPPPDYWWRGKEALARKASVDGWRDYIHSFANGSWPVAILGPGPWDPECIVPEELINELDLREKYPARGR